MNNRDNGDGVAKGGLVSDEQQVKESLQQHLDEQVENLDYTVVSKLSAARHRALAQQSTEAPHAGATRSWPYWTAALGSVAVLAIVSVVSLQLYKPTPTSAPPEEQVTQISQDVFIEDINLLSAADDIEFYQSVEFLEWMANNSG